MKMFPVLLCACVGAAIAGSGGCDDRREVVTYRDQVYVEQEPQVIVVREAPPPVIVERRSAAPSPRHLWVDGYWNWNGRKYAWVGGRWVQPPRASVVWVAPRYERHDRDYRYTPGHWREDGRGRGRD